MLAEAMEAGVLPEIVFYCEGEVDGAALDRAAARGAELVSVSQRVLRKLSDLPSVRGLVALAAPREVSLDALRADRRALILDGVQDPANVGSILRSAEAFGVEAVLLTSGCANPFGARALRASAGSVLRVPLAWRLAPPDAVAWARRRCLLLVGAEARGGDPPARLRGRGRVALVIGSEGHGLSAAMEAALDVRVTIPLVGHVESLNAAVASALLLYSLGEPTPVTTGPPG